MHRREVLAATGTLLMAGCTTATDQAPSTDSATRTETATDSVTEKSTPTPVPATFEVEVPPYSKAVADRNYRLRFNVTNTGEETGEFDTTLQLRGPDGDWEDVEGFGAVLDPGRTREFSVSIPTPDREEATYRLSGTDQSWTLTLLEPANYQLTITDAPQQIEIGEPLPVTV
jgi:hypothetical protein